MLVIGLVLVLGSAAQAMWSEDFESYALGASIDTCDVPTWTISVVGPEYLTTTTATVETDPDETQDDKVLDVACGGPGNNRGGKVIARKDFSGQFEPICDIIIIEYDFWHTADYRSGSYYQGKEFYFDACKVDDTPLVSVWCRDFGGNPTLNGVAFAQDFNDENNPYHMVYEIDFAADTVELTINGVPQVTAPLPFDAAPADLAVLKFTSALYYPKAIVNHTYYDNIQVPEPATLSLLLVGGLALLRRR
jgi:hypothetical protein